MGGWDGFSDRAELDCALGVRATQCLWLEQACCRLSRGRRLARGYAAPRQWAGLKFFNVYGPNETHKGGMQSLVSKILPTVKAGGSVTLFRSHDPSYPDGGQLRDFIYVKDCVAVVCWLLDTPKRADCLTSEPVPRGRFSTWFAPSVQWSDARRISGL